MAVSVDPTLPVHPLTVDDVDAMVKAEILGEDDHIELLDGVLVEMSPQSWHHTVAIRRLTMLLAPIAAAAGLDVSARCPLNVVSRISQPEPDLAVVPATGWDAATHAGEPLLVIEVSVTSRRIDLGRKAEIYAAAAIPEYWVLDLTHRRLVIHRDPGDGRYEHIAARTDTETVSALRLPLTVAVGDLMPPRDISQEP